MKNQTVSVSAANLIVAFVDSDSGVYHPVAAGHPSIRDQFQSLAAGPAIHHMAQSYLKEIGVDIGALKEKMSDAYSVRHFDGRVEGVPPENYSTYARWLCHSASGEDSLCDWRVFPELIDRLTKPYWEGVTPPLTRDDMKYVSLEAGGLIRQPSEASGTGGQGHKVRIFRPCKLHMPDAILQKLLDCEAFAKLSFEEMSTTHGGKKEGYFERNGQQFRLANNVGVNQHPLGLFTLQ